MTAESWNKARLLQYSHEPVWYENSPALKAGSFLLKKCQPKKLMMYAMTAAISNPTATVLIFFNGAKNDLSGFISTNSIKHSTP